MTAELNKNPKLTAAIPNGIVQPPNRTNTFPHSYCTSPLAQGPRQRTSPDVRGRNMLITARIVRRTRHLLAILGCCVVTTAVRSGYLFDDGSDLPCPGDEHRADTMAPNRHHCHAAAHLEGAAGVTGSGFIVLAATLSSVGTIPVASIALILGVDRFMSEARALTNLIGNGVATIVVAKWERALDEERMRQLLAHETELEAEEPEKAMPPPAPLVP